MPQRFPCQVHGQQVSRITGGTEKFSTGVSGLVKKNLDCTVVQSLYFLNFKPLAIFCGCTARFVFVLVRNAEDRFSHDRAEINV